MDLPNGIITLVFTDIQDSSELSERYRAGFEPLRAVHFRLLREAMRRWNGIEVSTAGDALFLVFVNACDAVQWAVDAQRTLAGYEWPLLAHPEIAGGQPIRVEVRVRIGMHTGEPFLSQDALRPDYFGPVVNRTARVSSAAHGGQILVSGATHELTATGVPEEITFQDRGLHRLKGVGADNLWQVQAPGLLRDFPPLKTLDPERHNLPTPPTPFLGREEEIQDWLGKLRQPSTRLLTLTGFGGLGKTRSALQLAESSLDDYKDGVWWVEAEEARTGEEMIQRIAGALHLLDTPIRDQVIRFLRDRNLLLVLDNTEQVEGAGRVVKELMDAAPRVKFLVTSRRALEIQAERVIELDPLQPSEAVQLFAGRVRDRQPHFELTPYNTADIAELCRRLDGVPLALELAASRVTTMSPRQMLQRLDERFRLLQTRAPDLPDRQRALRAAIDWSYDLLSEEDKHLFAQVSVFAGGFTLDDAEAVCEAFDVLEGIAELRRHSLLRSETETEEQQIRFVMLNSLREYAQEKLNGTGEGGVTRIRHARYFLEYAEQRLAQQRTPTEAVALHELAVNADNLRAAMEAAGAEGEIELFAHLGLVRGTALRLRGFSEEAVQPVQAALEKMHADPSQNTTLVAELLWEEAGLYRDLHSLEQAMATAQRARDLFAQAADRLGQARSENLLGMIAQDAGRYAEGRAFLEQALKRLRSPVDDTEIGNIYTNLGLMECSDPQGSLEEAERYLGEAQRLRRKQGDQRGLAEALNNLGIVAYTRENWTDAWERYAEALEHEKALRDAHGIARSLYNLAEVAQVRGERPRMLRLAAAAEHLMETVKSPDVQFVSDLLNAAASNAAEANEVEVLRRAARGQSAEQLIPWAMQGGESHGGA